jgi:hypothetical protein
VDDGDIVPGGGAGVAQRALTTVMSGAGCVAVQAVCQRAVIHADVPPVDGVVAGGTLLGVVMGR